MLFLAFVALLQSPLNRCQKLGLNLQSYSYQLTSFLLVDDVMSISICRSSSSLSCSQTPSTLRCPRNCCLQNRRKSVTLGLSLELWWLWRFKTWRMEPLTTGPWRNSSKLQAANQPVKYAVLLTEVFLFLCNYYLEPVHLEIPKLCFNFFFFLSLL